MATTFDQIKALDFGYLTGADLVNFVAGAYLIRQYDLDNDSLIKGCKTAYAEVTRKLENRYDVKTEITTKTGDAREEYLVKMVTILSIRNILGNFQNISHELLQLYKGVDDDIFAIRNAQMNLDLNATSSKQASSAGLVCAKFKTLG